MKAKLSALVAMVMTLAPIGVSAQDAYKWSDIDCAQSRIAPTPGVRCRGTNVVSGGATSGGQFQMFATLGTNPFSHLYLWESLQSGSYIPVVGTTAEYLQRMNKRFANAAIGEAAGNHGGVNYHLFKSNDEECMGFRKLGPSRAMGYAWIMGGLTCAAKGTPLTKARIAEFIDGARAK